MIVQSPDHKDAGAKRVTVIGAGTIGLSWAALFVAHGFETVIYDLHLQSQDVTLEKIGWTIQALYRARNNCGLLELQDALRLITFTTDLSQAVCHTDIIQENITERLDLKLQLFRKIDRLVKSTTLILSSTSGIMPSLLQNGFEQNAGNFLVGHPFNPPHLMPLVEVVPGSRTSEDAIRQTMAFYKILGRQPVHVHREIPGHIANRLQAAVLREVMYLLQEGVAEVSEIDTAMTAGPGLRWAAMGPSLSLHLGGGPAGAQGYAEKFLQLLPSWWAPKDPVMDDAAQASWVMGTEQTAGTEDLRSLESLRDHRLIEILNAREKLSIREDSESQVGYGISSARQRPPCLRPQTRSNCSAPVPL